MKARAIAKDAGKSDFNVMQKFMANKRDMQLFLAYFREGGSESKAGKGEISQITCRSCQRNENEKGYKI